MNRKSFLVIVSTTVGLLALSFALPLLQWLMSKLIALPEYRGAISSTVIIISISSLLKKTKASPFLPSLFQWKASLSLALVIVLGLLIFNIYNQPVSKITGQSRSPFEVLDIIVLLPLAEEMIFRGAIWSSIQKLLQDKNEHVIVLTGTSLLFGVEHLGYWAQSYWPLPFDAHLHATSMIFAGIVFGIFKIKSDSFGIPAAVHMLANGAILLAQ